MSRAISFCDAGFIYGQIAITEPQALTAATQASDAASRVAATKSQAPTVTTQEPTARSLSSDIKGNIDDSFTEGLTHAVEVNRSSSVQNINLTINPGECVVISGPSGCGKTTLTRMINGLIPSVYVGYCEGEVLVQGKSISDWEMDDLSCAVGSVFQNPRSQFFNLDTTSEIAFGCENTGIARDEIARRVAQTVDALKIAHLLERDIRALSGGEKQLIALASVYAMNPSIFVLDEPTAALDIRAMNALRETVLRLKELGKTILIAEHRLWWLSGVVDRIVLMDKGGISNDLCIDEFEVFTPEEHQILGLRAWNIKEVRPLRGNHLLSTGIEPSLCVRNLEVRYKRSTKPTIQNANFEAYPGRAIALVGRNGAGKTTFCRCLAGLHKESAGTIEVNGRELSAKQRAGKIYLAMQESGYQLFSDSVEGELRLALGARNTLSEKKKHIDNESTTDLIESKLVDFGLSEVRDRHPLSLSGGQRQRLAIAAGVLQGARIVILDEPTSGLDLNNMKRVATEIDHLKAAGTTIIIVTHDFEFACATCEEIAYVQQGKIADRFALTNETLAKTRALFGFQEG